MNKYKIFDNFLPETMFNDMFNLFTSPEFSWYYMNSVAYPNDFTDEDTLDNFYFIHQFYKNNQINSSEFKIIIPLLEKLNVFSLIRLQANLYTRTKEIVHHEYHTDSFGQKNLNWNTAVFYMNSNDGKTIIKENESETEIESVANRILIFPANTLHKSTTATNSKFRIVINVNYY